MENKEKFTLLESNISDDRFILLEADGEDEEETNNASAAEEEGEKQDSAKWIAEVKNKLLAIAKLAAEKKEALADSVKPADGERLEDVAKAHEKVKAKAEEVERALDGIEKRATEEADRFGAITAAELSMNDASDDDGEAAESAAQSILTLFDYLRPDVNDEKSLDAAKSTCGNIGNQLDAFSKKYTAAFENKQHRMANELEKERADEKNKKENDVKAAASSLIPSTETLPKGVKEIMEGQAFTEEVKAFGTKPGLNPFLTFLKSLHDSRQAIWNKIDAGYYALIHNAYVDNMISKQELSSGRCFALACDNIIVKPEFYAVPYSKAGEYLDLQRELCRAVDSERSVDNADALEAEFGLNRKEGSPDGTRFDAEVGQAMLYDKTGKLRDLNDVERYARAFLSDARGKAGKILKTAPNEIESALAKTLDCEPEELKQHGKDLVDAIRVLTMQAYLRGEIESLDYDLAKKALQAAGDASGEIGVNAKNENADKKWIKLFNCGNDDYKALLDSYLKTIANIFKPAKGGK